jgi:hypothetical protein
MTGKGNMGEKLAKKCVRVKGYTLSGSECQYGNLPGIFQNFPGALEIFQQDRCQGILQAFYISQCCLGQNGAVCFFGWELAFPGFFHLPPEGDPGRQDDALEGVEEFMKRFVTEM